MEIKEDWRGSKKQYQLSNNCARIFSKKNFRKTIVTGRNVTDFSKISLQYDSFYGNTWKNPKKLFVRERSFKKLAAGPIIPNIGSMGAPFGAQLLKKGHFVCLQPLNMPFLTVSNDNISFKSQGTRLDAIVATHEGLQ